MNNTKHRIFIIGSVWVEPNSSAAGARMLQLIELFISQNWEVSFATTASKNDNSLDLSQYGVQEYSISLNDSSFDTLIQKIDPTIVLFDRFMTEEQFGWRVADNCPNTMRILDTEDLHCLRKARQKAVKKDVDFDSKMLLTFEDAKREIASIYRCDLSLIISPFEMNLLKETFGVPELILLHIPFLLDPISDQVEANWNSFDEREHFVSIGSFLHPPNMDAAMELKNKIWPLIRKKLPNAEIHLYGSYPTQQAIQLNNMNNGFRVHGFVEDANTVISKSKVLLAPLRFGAGLKGKLVQAMNLGTPSVTTTIGSEGMHEMYPWPGSVADSIDDFVEEAVELYTNRTLWKEAQSHGTSIINNLYDKSSHQSVLLDSIEDVYHSLHEHRTNNFTGQMLQHHTMKSYKYLGKWIEEKNKNT